MRCEAVGRSGAETEPSEPLGKPGSVEAPGRQGGVPLFQQRCEAPSDSCIMLRGVLGREVRGEDAQKVVRAGGGAGAQEEPPRLQVIDGGNALEEPVLVIALTPKLARDERIMPQGGAEHGEALGFGRESPVTYPYALLISAQVADVWRLLPSGIPNPSFALMQADACPVPECGRESVVKRADTIRRSDDICIVEEREHSFPVLKLAVEVAERLVLRQRVQRGHQWIALSAALSLGDVVSTFIIVIPRVRAGVGVELAREGEEGLELRPRIQRGQHGASGDMIEGADRINRKHGGSRVCFGGGAEEPTHRFRP